MPIPDPPLKSSESLSIIIPKMTGTQHHFIQPGSAIVGYDPQNIPGTTLIYYEGNLFNIENLQTYWQRLLCAAGRCTQRYPTIARALFAAEVFKEQFEIVGIFNYALTHKQLVTENLRQYKSPDEIVEGNCHFYPHTLPLLEDWAQQSLNLAPGMLLVRTKTGSGKTSTLNSALNSIRNHNHRAITTIENPVE